MMEFEDVNDFVGYGLNEGWLEEKDVEGIKMKMCENKEQSIKQDSCTFGVASKSGSIKVYFDLSTMKEKEAKDLISKTYNIYKYMLELQ